MQATIISVGFILSLLLTADYAHAGGDHHRGYNWRHGHHSSHHHNRHHRHNAYHWNGHKRHHRRHHHHNNGSYLLGGVILGSLLTSAYRDNNYTSERHVVRRYYYPSPSSTSRVIYDADSPSTVTYEESAVIHNSDELSEPEAKLVLLKDLNGNCYSLSEKEGVEVRTQIESSACDF